MGHADCMSMRKDEEGAPSERSASGATKACPGASDAARRSMLPTRLTCGPASRRRPSLPPLLRGAATTCVQITARMHGHVLASD